MFSAPIASDFLLRPGPNEVRSRILSVLFKCGFPLSVIPG